MLSWLLLLLIAVFVLQNVLAVFFGLDGLLTGARGHPESFMRNWVALSPVNFLAGKVWLLFSYSLLHGSLFHLLANGLLIFFIGRAVLFMIGEGPFLKLYLSGVVMGAIAWLAVSAQTPHAVMIGASAGAFALLIYFCVRRPYEEITLLLFFVLPVRILPKWVGIIALAVTVFGLAFTELPGRDGSIAHSAHLGGMLAGYLFYRWQDSLVGWPQRLFRGPRMGVPAGNRRSYRPKYTVNVGGRSEEPSGSELRQEVDRILDKINEKGFGSLTEDEKQTLNRARDILSG